MYLYNVYVQNAQVKYIFSNILLFPLYLYRSRNYQMSNFQILRLLPLPIQAEIYLNAWELLLTLIILGYTTP